MAVSNLVSSAGPSGPLAWTVLSRVNASGTSVSFTGLSGYKSYRILGAQIKINVSGTEATRIRLNNDSSTIYQYYGVQWNSSSASSFQSINENGIWGGSYNSSQDVPVHFDCIIQAADQANMKVANTNFHSNTATATYYQTTTNVPIGVLTSIVVTTNLGNAYNLGTLTLLGGN
jgi:hypothetical protein